MKKVIPFLSLVFLSLLAYAQPTLTDANFGYSIGDQFSFRITTLPAYTTGSNHTWDFSTVTGGQAQNTTIVAPSTLGAGSNFPTANMAESYSAGGERYYNKTASQLELVGMNISNIIFTYTNPETSFKYPLTFGTTYSDDWACNFFSGTNFNRGGTTTVDANGYGTIKLPNGDFSTVLKVNINSVYGDTSIAGILSYTTTVDYWCLPGKPYPISSHAVTTSSAGPTIVDQYMDPVGPVSVENTQALEYYISYFPNPSSSFITVQAKVQNDKSYELIISSMEGKRLANYSLVGDKMSLDVSAYPSGTYMLELVSASGQKLAGQLVQVKH